MLRFDWNALRVGDRVVVHDHPFGTDFPLVPGTVAMVEMHRSQGGANGVGIRVPTDGEGDRVVWPSFLTAHHDPPAAADECWRCAALAAAYELVPSAAASPLVSS
jgi:hypothetical protein